MRNRNGVPMPSNKVYERVKKSTDPDSGSCVYLLLFLVILSFYISVEVFINEKIVDTEASSDTLKLKAFSNYTQRRTC